MAFTQLTAANSGVLRRLICNVQGHPKSSKTHWVLASCPEPVHYICFDPNGMEIAKKIVRETGRDIRYLSVGTPDRDQKPDYHKKQWASFRAACRDALAVNKGTLVIDSFTEVYDAVRLSLFGKTEQIMQRNYGAVYAELNDIINEAYESDMSMAVMHKLAPEFVKETATGNYRLDGWKNAPYAVQANFEVMFDPSLPPEPLAGRFRVCVLNNNMNMALNGWDYMGTPFTEDWFTFDMMLTMTFGGQ